MQSWQTDMLNIGLRMTLKPAVGMVSSLKYLRLVFGTVDRIMRVAVPRDLKRTTVDIPGSAFETEWLDVPETKQERVILYLPGGGYIMRTPNLHAAMVTKLCRASNARALMVYYRLAPEHPFPASLDDAVSAYQWLLAQGTPPENIIIAGDSAGGGLTLASLISLRDAGVPMPAGAIMISPVTDVDDDSPSRWKNAGADSLLPRPGGRAINNRDLYVGKNNPKDPRISPIHGDLTGLPPLYLQVSDAELVLDDSLRVARKGHIYNVDVKVDIWRKVPHVWVAFSFLPESRDAINKAAAFIKKKIPIGQRVDRAAES